MRDEAAPVLNLFARRPVAGDVKTRLIPVLGASGAARLARCMINWTVSNALAHWPGPVRLAVWPPDSVDWFRMHTTVPVVAQRGKDLGERMLASLAESVSKGIPSAVMGCDVPHVDGTELARAAQLLGEGYAVTGPAADGGFFLIGLSVLPAGLFDDIEWGSADVYRRLLANAQRQAFRFTALEEVDDIDRPSDLERVAARYPPLAGLLESLNGEGHG